MVTLAPYDQRFVNRVDSGFASRSSHHSLCDACGVGHDCGFSRSVSAHQTVMTIKMRVYECSLFRPVLAFRDSTGLENTFNTFRRGLGWFNRVSAGNVVSIYDADKDVIIGQATVQDVHSGTLDDMLTLHADSNHLMKEDTSGNPIEKLHQTLRKLYGINYAALDADYTVIDLKFNPGEHLW